VKRARLTVGSTVSHVTVAPPFGVRFISLLATSMVAAVVEASFCVYRKGRRKMCKGDLNNEVS